MAKTVGAGLSPVKRSFGEGERVSLVIETTMNTGRIVIEIRAKRQLPSYLHFRSFLLVFSVSIEKRDECFFKDSLEPITGLI